MALMATAFGTKVAIAALSLVAIGGGTAVAAAGDPSFDSQATVQTGEPSATSSPDDTETATPASSDDPTETPTPMASPTAAKGPDASGPAAFGLCTAYTAGGLHNTSVAYAALLKASQSAGSIADYCAPILTAHHRGQTPTPAPAAPITHGQAGTEKGHGSSDSHGH
ncbi:MAG: hypothetical protein M3N46_14435 [Actinomycetota bacterium]|nr:hypothetical protein [Actinomycetota bacterium]